MLQAGILGSFATDWLGPENVRTYGFQFREQVWPGDTLTCSGTVTKRYEEDGERRVDVELICARQTGGAAIKGTATFAIP
jgi:acyl dehydratase